MKVQFHLVVNKSGTIRTTKNRPGLNWDEVEMLVNLELPDALFRKPVLSANITIPPEAAIQEPISAEVQENVKDAIHQVTGLNVRLTIVNEEGAGN